MKRILIPTDFSDCAQAAQEVAHQLALQSNAELVYLHLAIDKSGPTHVPGQTATPTSRKEEVGVAYQLQQMVKEAEKNHIKAKYHLVLGNGQERIEDYIEPLEIDLLVMGSHGATGIREAIIGSKTQHVIRHLKIPSLVIKRKPSHSIFQNIVFASTFKKDITIPIQKVIEFASIFNSKLHFLFINLYYHLIADEVAQTMMRKQVPESYIDQITFNITETNDKEFGIEQFSEQIKSDVISVVMEQKGLLGNTLNPALAERLINHSDLPILVIPS